ncbi:ACT domain-containing protein [Marinobacter sp. M1N3S26]|uniref:ACT domain-containing protein n=1 Tax=unclassified Marinobacter TaxID=83889 RepID=UPI00387B3599
MNAHEQEIPSYQIHCRMNPEAAALERLCQVVRIRGFRISKMAMESSGDALDIALTLEGTRPIGMLQSQLEKLQTVARVEWRTVSPDLVSVSGAI